MASLSARSHMPAWALTPCARISFVVVSSAAWPRAHMETAAPAPANASAIDRPIPLLPPVTTTRLPCKLICINSSREHSETLYPQRTIASRPKQILQGRGLKREHRKRLKHHLDASV